MKKTLFVSVALLVLMISTAIASPDGYVKCANEGDTVNFKQLVNVKYGANGIYAEKFNVTGDVVFTNDFFGDPIYGVFKEGFYKNVTVNKIEPVAPKVLEKPKSNGISHATRERRNKAQGKETFPVIELAANHSGTYLESKNPKSILKYIFVSENEVSGRVQLTTINGIDYFKPRLANASYFQIIKYGMKSKDLGNLFVGFSCTKDSKFYQLNKGIWEEIRFVQWIDQEKVCYADTNELNEIVTNFAVVSN